MIILKRLGWGVFACVFAKIRHFIPSGARSHHTVNVHQACYPLTLNYQIPELAVLVRSAWFARAPLVTAIANLFFDFTSAIAVITAVANSRIGTNTLERIEGDCALVKTARQTEIVHILHAMSLFQFRLLKS